MTAQETPAAEKRIKAKGSFNLSALLMGGVVFMAILTFGAMYFKGVKPKGVAPAALPTSAEVDDKKATQPTGYASREDVEKAFGGMNKKVDDLAKAVEQLSHRTWLLAVAHNENVSITQKNECAAYGRYTDYIVFDANWKLNRQPTLIQMSDEQRKNAGK